MNAEPTRDQIAQDYAQALAIIDRLKTSQLELLAALKIAVQTIEIWHNFPHPSAEHAEVWALYQASPEMRLIAAAIAKAEGR